MFNLSSRMKLPTRLTLLAAFAIVSAAPLSTPAFATAQSALVNACKRMGPHGCTVAADTPGYAAGCSANACFECINGKCGKVGGAPLLSGADGKYKPGPGSIAGSVSSTSRTTSSKPTAINNPGTTKMRTGGKH